MSQETNSVADYSSLNTVTEKEALVVKQMTEDRSNGTTKWVQDSTTLKTIRTIGKVTTGGLVVVGAYAIYNHFSE